MYRMLPHDTTMTGEADGGVLPDAVGGGCGEEGGDAHAGGRRGGNSAQSRRDD